jgi:hypothetical protein
MMFSCQCKPEIQNILSEAIDPTVSIDLSNFSPPTKSSRQALGNAVDCNAITKYGGMQDPINGPHMSINFWESK